ncbi:uncharacterized protein LOC119727794, partial [Patiria miniata]|uniref:DUF7869 domain-containing protein n=1 Tax=Patiria miniata TaxID=46514 RepID=A0A913ZW89_PATMI
MEDSPVELELDPPTSQRAAPHKITSGGRKFNTRALTVKDIERVVQFISSYAEEHALVIPGRVSGVKCQDPRVRLLPSSETKSSVWRKYQTYMGDMNSTRRLSGDPDFCIVKQVTFTKLWSQYCPFVLTTRPKTDLCWVCQRNNSLVYQSANQLDGEKLAQLRRQEEHLRVVNMERDLYRSMVADCKQAVGEEHLGLHQPASRRGTAHYSFDFAQQVHYPHNPNQPGPMYFLCPRKCGIFGVCCEGIPEQVNYLVDEGMSSSKGSNAVLSYLHHFFLHYGLGEENVELHCDNCSGQNKNNFVMWYFVWRTLHGFHDNVAVNFLIAGHTKFSPDWCFGLLKQRYRKCVVSCLGDLEEVVRTSTRSGV